ncbi:nucleotidyltransferase family protein [Candidatus Woesearchaeota archaeon]|nr:nucleotidyltransferase family protein [Candidatus Woesearchaeota archaeon]
MKINYALMLAGGKGERLRPYTDNMQKTLMPIQGRAILDYNIALLKRHNINTIVLGIGYLGDKVRQHFENKEIAGIIFSEETEPLGTGGALRLASGHLKETFVMCNGDELKDIDIYKMLEIHRKNNALVTIALTEADDPTSFGVARLDGSRILEFVEKPKRDEAPSNMINSGLYIIEPEVIGMLPEGKSSLEKEIFPTIAKQGRLFGYKFSGQWFPTDTPERYHKAEKEWKNQFNDV